ncbi:MAG: hypothetical protein WAK17_17420 [Candidatus Nitrosopolaris sp.]
MITKYIEDICAELMQESIALYNYLKEIIASRRRDVKEVPHTIP